MPNKLADEPEQSKTIRAAGAVAWRPGEEGQPEILLVHRSKYDDWSLPKGKVDPGEPLPLTAIREVFEEGGAHLTLGRRLKPVRYKVNGRAKVVAYWSARVTGVDERAVPNGEVDRIAWVSVAEARKQVSYARDIGVLDDFDAAPAATEPLILLRHAMALPRADWRGDDMDRPLDDRGRADAAALAGLLACFAPQAAVVSSATVRCLDTVGPYVARTGAPVRAAVALRASSSITSQADAHNLLVAAVKSGAPAIICAHRENLPALLATAASALGAPSVPPAAADPLPTGAFVAFHMADGALVAADRYELPGS
jgi:8-oxo-(d)GTP phosphatase